MKSISREFLNPAEVISADNILEISERISLRALRTVLSRCHNVKLNRLYIGLNRDVAHKHVGGYVFSDGYDLVQTAACFLCEHIGERLDKICGKNTRGRAVTVNTACFNLVNRQVMRLRKESFLLAYENCPEVINLCVPDVVIEEPEDYSVADKTIEEMNLTDSEREVLCCYMAGMKFGEIVAYLSLAVSTVWKRRKALQSKYDALHKP